MITEKNIIKTEFSDFKTFQKTLWQKLYICSIVALAVGICGVLAYIVLSTVWETLYEYSPAWCEALLVFAVPLGIGIVFTLTFRSMFKQSEKQSDLTYVYEFYSDCFIFREFRGGEETAVVRLEYNRIVKAKEKGQFVVLRQLGGASLPIDKTKLSEAELNTLKKLLRLPVPQNAEITELASSAECGAQIALVETQTHSQGE